jgi:hypothetical protein
MASAAALRSIQNQSPPSFAEITAAGGLPDA